MAQGERGQNRVILDASAGFKLCFNTCVELYNPCLQCINPQETLVFSPRLSFTL